VTFVFYGDVKSLGAAPDVRVIGTSFAHLPTNVRYVIRCANVCASLSACIGWEQFPAVNNQHNMIALTEAVVPSCSPSGSHKIEQDHAASVSLGKYISPVGSVSLGVA
jgi:hypothetical protein